MTSCIKPIFITAVGLWGQGLTRNSQNVTHPILHSSLSIFIRYLCHYSAVNITYGKDWHSQFMLWSRMCSLIRSAGKRKYQSFFSFSCRKGGAGSVPLYSACPYGTPRVSIKQEEISWSCVRVATSLCIYSVPPKLVRFDKSILAIIINRRASYNSCLTSIMLILWLVAHQYYYNDVPIELTELYIYAVTFLNQMYM